MRSSTLLLLSTLAVAALAACTAGTGETSEATEQDLSSSRGVTCKQGNATFTIDPGPGPVLQGALTVPGQSLRYACNNPTSADPAGTLAVCDELPQTWHPGQWKFLVSRAAGGLGGALDRGDGAPVSFACAVNPAVDAGPPADGGPGADAGADGATGPATFADIKPLLDAACKICHDDWFQTLEGVKARRAKMIQLISVGRMPRNNPAWKDSPEGIRALEWLKTSPELD